MEPGPSLRMEGGWVDPKLARQAQFRDQGIAIVTHALAVADLEDFSALMPAADGDTPGCRLTGDVLRTLASHRRLQALASDMVAALPACGPGDASPQLIRAIAFDKQPRANWFVPWHQDLVRETVTASCSADTAGPHKSVTALDVLERIVALRIHLDDCTEDNGPLEVVLGSHRLGVLGPAGVQDVVATGQARVCLADRGDILVLSPLTVHRSQRSLRPGRRRVLHLEYVALDQPLRAKTHLLAAGTC